MQHLYATIFIFSTTENTDWNSDITTGKYCLVIYFIINIMEIVLKHCNK